MKAPFEDAFRKLMLAFVRLQVRDGFGSWLCGVTSTLNSVDIKERLDLRRQLGRERAQ